MDKKYEYLKQQFKLKDLKIDVSPNFNAKRKLVAYSKDEPNAKKFCSSSRLIVCIKCGEHLVTQSTQINLPEHECSKIDTIKIQKCIDILTNVLPTKAPCDNSIRYNQNIQMFYCTAEVAHSCLISFKPDTDF